MRARLPWRVDHTSSGSSAVGCPQIEKSGCWGAPPLTTLLDRLLSSCSVFV